MKPGDRLADRFDIERVAGVGATGTVYRARDRERGEPVAVKVVFANRPDALRRFARESEILGALDHPGIVDLVTSGATAEGQPYLVMEWLEGEDLAARLGRAPLGRADAVLVAVRVAEALSAAHAKGIVHRDVKPANVFLVDRDVARVRLLDFGIAHATGDAESARPGAIVGTLGYVAPEQARGATDVSPRADVFSLGCVLFECLAGRAPFLGDHPMALLAKILLEDAPRVTDVASEVSNELADLVARMLAKDPAIRPADGGVAARELGGLASIDDEPATRSSPRPLAISAGEMRMISVALLVGDAPIAELVAQIGLRGASPARERRSVDPRDAERSRALEKIVAAHGARFDELGEDALLITIAGSGVATDQVARAARCALAVRAIAPHGTMALVTARGLARGGLPIGPVIDKAQGLVHATLFGGREPAIDDDPTRADEDASRVDVLVDETTATLLDGRFVVDRARDGERFTLLAEREVATTRTRSILGVTTVGREHELAHLRESFDAVKRGSARGVLVTAPPGAGKTRLRDELLRDLARVKEKVVVWTAEADATRAGAPFALLTSLLERDPDPAAAFASQRAFEDRVALAARDAPLVIAVDDLQWGDLPSVTFLETALRRLEGTRVFLVALARPEVHRVFPRLKSTPRLDELRLRDLDDEASTKLVRMAFDLAGAEIDAVRVAAIVSEASGNPFFLEELADVALKARSTGRGTPATILAMIEARLGALDSESRRVLRAASVFGEEVWLGGVDALVGGMHEKDLAGWIGELEKSEILLRKSESRFAGETAFVFRQRLFREAAYATLTEADRALGHRLAAAWLIGHGDDDALAIAHHYEKGGDIDRALHFHRRAAEQALRANDFDRAIARADRAVDCGAEGEMLGRLGAIQAEARRWRGELREAAALAHDAVKVLPKPSAPWTIAVGEALQASGALGDDAAVISLADDLESVKVPEIGQAPIVSALALATSRLLVAGHRLRAERILARIDEVAEEHETDAPLAFARVGAARAIHALVTGDAAGYLEGSRTAAAAYARAGDERGECLLLVHAGHAEIEVGRYREAEETLDSAIATATRLRLRHVELVGKQHLGLAVGFLGRLDDGLASLREAAAGAASIENPRLEAAARRSLAILSALRRDLDTANVEAERAVELTQALPSSRAVALAVLARVALARGEIGRARAAAIESASIYDRVRAVDAGESFIRLALAEALHASGDEAGGREAIRAARDRLFDRAASIEDAALKASFLENVAENAWTLSLARTWIGPATAR